MSPLGAPSAYTLFVSGSKLTHSFRVLQSPSWTLSSPWWPPIKLTSSFFEYSKDPIKWKMQRPLKCNILQLQPTIDFANFSLLPSGCRIVTQSIREVIAAVCKVFPETKVSRQYYFLPCTVDLPRQNYSRSLSSLDCRQSNSLIYYDIIKANSPLGILLN